MRDTLRTFACLVAFVLFVAPSAAQENLTSHFNFENELSYLQSNFKNLSVYLSFLDDIFSHLSSYSDTSEKCKLETNILLQKAKDGDSKALKSK